MTETPFILFSEQSVMIYGQDYFSNNVWCLHKQGKKSVFNKEDEYSKEL